MPDTITERIRLKHQGDEKQLEVIFSPHKRLLVEAPAGYGKTHTMVSRIAYLIVTGNIPTPKRLLALTFSVNAAYKIKKDVSRNIPDLLKDVEFNFNIKDKIFVSNYHGFCRSVLKKYGQVIHPILTKLDTLESIDDSNIAELMRSFKGMTQEQAEKLFDFNTSVKRIEQRKVLNNIKEYNDLVISELLTKDVIPFNAIITLTIKLLNDYKNIRTFYQNYFSTILVDEFQDTNILSYWLLNILITDKTNVIFLGDSLQRIYGFIGAVPDLLARAQNKFRLERINLEKNHRFESNENMLKLDKLIRQNAITPFSNPTAIKTRIIFNIYDDQATESIEIVKKALSLISLNADSHVAIIVKQRGPNVNDLIETFINNKVPFFFGLFTDEDVNYLTFNYNCLHEFIELIKGQSRITKKLSESHINKIKEIYFDDESALSKALTELLKVFWRRVFIEYSFLSNEDKINLIKDTFNHNGLKQYMEFLDARIIISTVHAAKGLEWDYVLLPDMEQDSFPNWSGLCGSCNSRNDCRIVIDSSNEKNFLEELSVFYVAVTRAKKQVFFSASKSQLTRTVPRLKNISCFVKLPGLQY